MSLPTLAFGEGRFAVFLGIGHWGLHMRFTESVLPALIAHAAPERLFGDGVLGRCRFSASALVAFLILQDDVRVQALVL